MLALSHIEQQLVLKENGGDGVREREELEGEGGGGVSRTVRQEICPSYIFGRVETQHTDSNLPLGYVFPIHAIHRWERKRERMKRLGIGSTHCF